MERQLVKQGKNALTLTLPATWIKKRGLQAKDSININELNENLIISSSKKLPSKEIEIDITNLSKSLAFHIISGRYIEGYDKLIIKHNNFKLSQKIGISYFGMIVEEHDEKKLIMKSIVNLPEDNFNEIFKRTCQALIKLSRLLLKQLDKKIKYQEIKYEERLYDTTILYCLRYINKYENIENSHKYFLLFGMLEAIGDFISTISKELINIDTASEMDIYNINLVVKTIESYVVYLFSNDVNSTHNLISDFKKNIKKENFIGGLVYGIEELLSNFVGFMIEK